ncbi:MAG: ABC transporter permease subunit [Gemmatimonadota bacterium]|nr:ABC transporter permease subunit [Gemmatimonadota bacterium]
MTRATRFSALPSLRAWLVVLLAAWSLLPLVLLVVISVSGGWRFPSLLGADPGLDAWRSLRQSTGRLLPALYTSLGLGVGTGGLAAVLGLPIGRALSDLRGVWRFVGAGCAFLPVAAPPLALGVGLQYSFLRAGLGGSAVGVTLAHLIPALGYTSLFFLGVFAVFDRGVEAEARRLGAGGWQTLTRVTLPLLRRPLAEAFVLGFLVSWAQVPLTLLVGQGRVRTLTVEVLSWVQAGQDPLAAAGATLLVIPPLLLMGAAALGFQRAQVVAP